LFFLAAIESDIVRNHLEEIYHLYAKELNYVSHGILRDYHEAEHIVQSAMIKVSHYIDENTDVRCNRTRGLLVIIVRRLSYNVYNQRKRRSDVNIEDMEDHIRDDKALSPELNILRLEDRKYVAKLMASINESYMDILTLKYMYEYSDKEISDMLSISEGNVRTKLSRARKACQRIIGGDQDEK